MSTDTNYIRVDLGLLLEVCTGDPSVDTIEEITDPNDPRIDTTLEALLKSQEFEAAMEALAMAVAYYRDKVPKGKCRVSRCVGVEDFIEIETDV